MRVTGILKVMAVLTIDFVITYFTLGLSAAIVLSACIAIYLWAGEYIDLWRQNAVAVDHLDSSTRSRLTTLQCFVAEDVKRVTGADISSMKLYVTSAQVPNAYTYGRRSVSVTRFLLDNCDDATLCAVLGHEASHLLHMDAVFNRAVFANVTILLIGLSLGSLISVSFLWIVFILLILFGVCGGVLSLFLMHGMGKLIKGVYTAIQHIVLFVYRTAMGICSRHSEYKADSFSCSLGYGPQLRYFLMRFQEMPQERGIQEVLYASHPPVSERVFRIEQQEGSQANS